MRGSFNFEGYREASSHRTQSSSRLSKSSKEDGNLRLQVKCGHCQSAPYEFSLISGLLSKGRSTIEPAFAGGSRRNCKRAHVNQDGHQFITRMMARLLPFSSIRIVGAIFITGLLANYGSVLPIAFEISAAASFSDASEVNVLTLSF
ncbi:hypothetical protein GR702_21145 [Novosphingobium sp. FGD1]|uniref:Uncharacterized protein n=1 Tax=Novosphingobium silvae TaxID=2692619 RepID=A0A7X4KA99_9SPHN|nr:hypothetical protein [Novosphingobium silvae]MYM00254.1 hypothetical protein [Novosphingobium silvae]